MKLFYKYKTSYKLYTFKEKYFKNNNSKAWWIKFYNTGLRENKRGNRYSKT